MIIKRTKIFISLAILALVLIAIGLQMLTHPSLKYLFNKPTNYAQCLDAGGAILESYPSQCSYRGQTFTNPEEKPVIPPPTAEEEQPKAPSLKTYTDAKNGFSFEYDTNIFTETRVQEKLPWKNKSIDSLLLVHTVPVQHCGLSGLPEHCQPTTTDLSIAFTPLAASLADVVAASSADFGGLQNVSFGPIGAKMAVLGVEGEGNVYYLISTGPQTSLMITRSFIDESVVGGYQNVKDFITLTDQEKIFNALMATFKLTK
jgi:hypothetical protein